jgi:hypothetical protein
MRKTMSKRPSIKDYTWNEIYSKTDSEGKHSLVVLGTNDEPYSFFRVQESRYGNKAPQKIFYGETAWMDVQRYVHDQSMEYWDFDVEQCHLDRALKIIDAFSRVSS